MADYWKFHGLGNDYLVIEPGRFMGSITPEAARKICDRSRGVGSDGLLIGPGFGPETKPPSGGLRARSPEGEPFPVRIVNPDGSEAEKSGNGLRIFARFLWERGYARGMHFRIAVVGGTVVGDTVVGDTVVGDTVGAEILHPAGSPIALEMGRVTFTSGEIPMGGPEREVLREPLAAGGREWLVSAAGLGNPHCVVETDDPTPELAREFGPQIENHPQFPNRTNVQFMTVLDEQRVRIEIWERGAGYTLSSGSSSCACAAVACRLGLCRSPVTVVTAGGNLTVALDENFHARLEGEVCAVGHGFFSGQFLKELGLRRAEEEEKEG